MSTEQEVKKLGRDCGFDLVRIGPAGEMHVERARYLDWIAAGRHAEMRWINDDWAARASDPTSTLPDAQAVISVAIAYSHALRSEQQQNEGKIARYAWGRDYHAVLGERLNEFAARLESEIGGAHRWFVDTGPAMDKALAARSGLGWYGKNTNILTERFGSFVLLGEVITTLALTPDAPLNRDCGSCRLCVVACPTGALGPDYSIDSSKCISYLTIEHRGWIPRELRPAIGSWVFGCDICQDVCPPSMQPYLHTTEQRRAWAEEVRRYIRMDSSVSPGAAQAPSDDEPQASVNSLYDRGIRAGVDLLWLLRLTHDEYLEAFRGTAVKRAKVWMLRRNAAVALGNVGDEGAIQPLAAALRSDKNPLVRGHAAWALGHLGARLDLPSASEILENALESESDLDTRGEIEWSRLICAFS